MKPGTQKQAEIFNLDKDEAYLRWRDWKLESAPRSADDLLVEISDLTAPSEIEKREILRNIDVCNMAVYACGTACDEEDEVRRRTQTFNAQFGLNRCETHRSQSDGGLVAIEIVENEKEGRHGFIPYTNRPISWHTDGYYNPTSARIKAMTLHCVRPAPDGGVNDLFDPELAYIRLRDENPDYIRAFSHRRAMTIPSFVEDNGRVRAESSGPVFTWDRYTGNLYMRYTDRKRNIDWRKDQTTADAVAFLRQVLAEDDLIISYKMTAGQGLICNNVLHTRTAFADNAAPGQGRLMLRARYMDRIEAIG